MVSSNFEPLQSNDLLTDNEDMDQNAELNLLSSVLCSLGNWFLFCFLFVLLLYVQSQQLWSWRDGQFT